ncbi:MAG TPA: hypothetical protein VE153_32180 [Myxococcus sp.]|nr:hypothetical protein [Myxococcus sp.]
MGDELKSKQNEQFVHGQDRAKKELSQDDLLTLRPELVSVAFSCKSVRRDVLPSPGAEVLVADTGETLLALADGEPVGTINEPAALQFRELMGKFPEFQGMFLATVYETAGFLEEFTIRLVTGGAKE